MPEGEHWVLDKSAKTNHSHGSKPYGRTIEQLLECGVVLVNKPPGPTSHQLAAWARNIMGISRIGHGGTLDPFATGLLTLLIGRATKVTGVLLTKPKRYVAVLRFRDGVQTEAISEILGMMDGEVYNVPPKESAVKVQVRSRIIHKIRLLDSDESGRLHVISIHCDAGTYVRTMARDMGLILGTGCELLELHRVSSGRFDDSMSCTMQQLTDAVFMWREHGDGKGLSRLLAPIESILDEMPRLVVKDGAVAAVSHGAPLARPGLVSAPKGLGVGSTVLICSIKGEAVAIASLTVKSDALPDMDAGQVAVASTVLMPPGEYPQTWAKEQS